MKDLNQLEHDLIRHVVESSRRIRVMRTALPHLKESNNNPFCRLPGITILVLLSNIWLAKNTVWQFIRDATYIVIICTHCCWFQNLFHICTKSGFDLSCFTSNLKYVNAKCTFLGDALFYEPTVWMLKD